MTVWSKPWSAGDVTGQEQLETLVAGLGENGDAADRRDAVVALLAGGGTAPGRRGGAFALTLGVTAPLTDGLHNCLREQSVSIGQQKNQDRLSRKQC